MPPLLSAAPPPQKTPAIPVASTGIADSGATNIYYAPGAPLLKLDPSAPWLQVVMPNGNMALSSSTAKECIP